MIQAVLFSLLVGTAVPSEDVVASHVVEGELVVQVHRMMEVATIERIRHLQKVLCPDEWRSNCLFSPYKTIRFSPNPTTYSVNMRIDGISDPNQPSE